MTQCHVIQGSQIASLSQFPGPPCEPTVEPLKCPIQAADAGHSLAIELLIRVCRQRLQAAACHSHYTFRCVRLLVQHMRPRRHIHPVADPGMGRTGAAPTDQDCSGVTILTPHSGAFRSASPRIAGCADLKGPELWCLIFFRKAKTRNVMSPDRSNVLFRQLINENAQGRIQLVGGLGTGAPRASPLNPALKMPGKKLSIILGSFGP